MHVTPLPLALKAAGMAIEDGLPAATSGSASRDEVLALCAAYRRFGVCKLLLTGVPDELFVDLSKSASAYLHYLRRPGRAPLPTSAAAPFFDALACDGTGDAAAIAELSEAKPMDGEEYEDDFLYVFSLMTLFRDASTDITPLLDRYEAVLEGQYDARLDVCRALAARDARLFDEALDAFMEEREARFERLFGRGALDPDDAVSTERVSVEGLALARLAALRGMAIRKDHLLVPSIARKVHRAKRPAPDAWMTIAGVRQLR